MSEHNKYTYKLDSGRLPERNNHRSWRPIIHSVYVVIFSVYLFVVTHAYPLSVLAASSMI